MTTSIIQGDCLDVLRGMDADSVQCVVTSPPYWGLRDYGVDGAIGLESTLDEFIAKMVEVFREVRRVLRKDGCVWINLGDTYAGGTPGTGGSGKHSKLNCKRADDGTFHKDNKSVIRFKARTPSWGTLKPKDLCGVPWRVALALQADGWWLRSDVIWAKCLSGGVRVYARTQKGDAPMTIKDMARLDPATVQLWNSTQWTQVLGVYASDRGDAPVELVLRNGERIGCTSGHRWPTRDRGIIPADELRAGDVLCSVDRYLPGLQGMCDASIANDDVGWFVGLFLAEGSYGKGGEVIQIASHTRERARFERLQSLADTYGGTCRTHQTSERGCTINLYGPVLLGILRQYVSGKLAHGKHLHPRCWRHRRRFLQAILDGYLEGDGHRRQNEWRLGFCNNDSLADDLRTLGARLGLSVRLKRTQHTMNGRKFPGWRGSIRKPEHRRTEDRQIMSIGKSRARKFWDITVADHPHTFALASGTLTHNSNPMPESCTDRPTKAHEYVFLLTKASKYFYDAEAVRERNVTIGDAREGAGRHTYDGKCDGTTGTQQSAVTINPAGRNLRSVWTIPTQSFKKAHFATFPQKLVEPCLKAGTSAKGCCPECGTPWVRVVDKATGGSIGHGDWKGEGVDGLAVGNAKVLSNENYRPATTVGWQPGCKCGRQCDTPCNCGEFHKHPPNPCTVLDPFAGSGTVGVVCKQMGLNFIGIELNPEYADMARKRIANPTPEPEIPDVEGQLQLFEETT